MKDFNDYVGKELEVFVNNTSEIKTITVKKVSDTSLGTIFFDEEGIPYHEDEVNWVYKITPEYLLYNTLKDNDVNIGEWEPDTMKKVFEDFMNSLVKVGYVKESE